MNILALDIGTTSMRGILYGQRGSAIAAHSVQTPLEHSAGGIEQRPARLADGVVQIIHTLAAEHAVDAISLTAFRSAVCLVDRAGAPLCNFLMWQDTRNRDICKRYEADSEFVFQKSGAKVNTVFTATRLLWLRENEPELYARAYKAVIVPDYLIHRMTGEFVTDRTYGSRTHLMNLRSLAWDDELCALFHVDKRLLCPLIDQGSVAGYVSGEFAAGCGLRAGIPVISAGGDQQCAALGLGVIDADTIEINCGTGSFVISVVDEPALENSAMICNVSALRGKYIVESNVLSSASALNWFVREFYPELPGESPDLAAVDRIVAQTPAGANGVFCLPHFQGCGTRAWNAAAKAAFWGVTLCSTRAEMTRALYEGIAAEIAKSVACLPPACRGASRVCIAGGLTKSEIFNHILCNMLGRPLRRYADPQATAIGAYVSAATTLGLYADERAALASVRGQDTGELRQPDAETTALYAQLIAQSERVYRLGLDG